MSVIIEIVVRDCWGRPDCLTADWLKLGFSWVNVKKWTFWKTRLRGRFSDWLSARALTDCSTRDFCRFSDSVTLLLQLFENSLGNFTSKIECKLSLFSAAAADLVCLGKILDGLPFGRTVSPPETGLGTSSLSQGSARSNLREKSKSSNPASHRTELVSVRFESIEFIFWLKLVREPISSGSRDECFTLIDSTTF